MPGKERDCRNQGNDIFEGSIIPADNAEGMGKEERKELVLKLLDESDVALTPYVMFRNLKMRGATFERRTLGNYVSELLDEGRIEKLDVDGDPLYVITDAGRASISN